jgi:adenylate cyclase
MVARELGVRHVLEGSVRRAGGRVRIAAQLIDGASGAHAWAERYDRTMEDIFDLQDQITTEITTALQVELTEGEQARLRRRGTRSLTAWDLFLRSQHHFRQFAQVDNRLAREFLDDALNLDPGFSSAWAMKSWTYIEDARLAWSYEAKTSIEKGIEAAQKGISANDEESDAYAMMGRLHLLQRQYQKSENAIKRAIEFAPSTADHHVAYGFLLNMTERPSEALAQIELGMRLSPFYPEWYLGFLGMSYRLLGQTREAIAIDLKRLERNPNNSYSDVRLAAAYAELGEMEQARHHVDKALRKLPNYRLSNVPQTDPYRDADVMNHYVELLRAAGLPE